MGLGLQKLLICWCRLFVDLQYSYWCGMDCGKFNKLSISEWKSMKESSEKFISVLDDAGCFSKDVIAREQEKALCSEYYEALYKKEDNDSRNTKWIHHVENNCVLPSMVFDLALLHVRLEDNISVSRQSFCLQILAEIDRMTNVMSSYNPRDAHCEYIEKLLRCSTMNESLVVIPMCFGYHWGFVLIDAKLETVARQSNSSTTGEGVLWWGDSYGQNPRHGRERNILSVIEAIVKVVFPNVEWSRSGCNYMVGGSSVLGFGHQKDGYSCGFYVLSFILQHSRPDSTSEFAGIGSYRPYYSKRTTNLLRHACLRLAVRATLYVINEDQGVNDKKSERNLYNYINVRWPFPAMRKEVETLEKYVLSPEHANQFVRQGSDSVLLSLGDGTFRERDLVEKEKTADDDKLDLIDLLSVGDEDRIMEGNIHRGNGCVDSLGNGKDSTGRETAVSPSSQPKSQGPSLNVFSAHHNPPMPLFQLPPSVAEVESGEQAPVPNGDDLFNTQRTPQTQQRPPDSLPSTQEIAGGL